MSIVVKNAQILSDQGWEQIDNLVIVDGKIASFHVPILNPDQVIDAKGGYILPGIVDLHGDAFERHITPRAGTNFPLSLAIAANDGSLISNGITTFFYSITDGFEPGPRSRETVRCLLNEIEEMRPRLNCNSYIHIRHETVNTKNHEELMQWLERNRIDLLSLNDHLPSLDNEKKVKRYLAGLKRRVTMTEEESLTFIQNLQEQRPLGEKQVEELVELSHQKNITLASHDDANEDDLNMSIKRGVAISEFPMSYEIAKASMENGSSVVMGAPNLVRGGSHVGGMSVKAAVEQGVVNIICSDYHYPSLFQAPFILSEMGLLDLKSAWDMVSQNPAMAVGLDDKKGKIAIGYDADLLLLSHLDGSPLSIKTVFNGGRPVMQRESIYEHKKECEATI